MMPFFLRLIEFLPKGLFEPPVLVYHSIEENIGVRQDSLSLDNFRRQLNFFKTNNFDVVSLGKMVEIIKYGKKLDKPTISITFDDGYSDIFSLVFPLLQEFGFPAGIFIVVDNIGRDGYVDCRQLKEMSANDAVNIGSHSLTHTYLPGLGPKELHYEIGESKRILEDSLGAKVDFFAYPWGGFTPEIQKIVRDCGYQAAFTTNMNIYDKCLRGDNLYAIKRLTMNENDSHVRFLIKVSGFGTCFARKMRG